MEFWGVQGWVWWKLNWIFWWDSWKKWGWRSGKLIHGNFDFKNLIFSKVWTLWNLKPFQVSSWNSNFSKQFWIPSIPKVLLSTKKFELSTKNWSTTIPKINPKNKSQKLGNPWEKPAGRSMGKFLLCVCLAMIRNSHFFFLEFQFWLVCLPELKSKSNASKILKKIQKFQVDSSGFEKFLIFFLRKKNQNFGMANCWNLN